MLEENTRKREYWWGSNLPNDVAASLDPVVQKGETRVGDQIGETHVDDCVDVVYGDSTNVFAVVEWRVDDWEEFSRPQIALLGVFNASGASVPAAPSDARSQRPCTAQCYLRGLALSRPLLCGIA